MIRAMRRTLRQWKREFIAFWGRFTAFHRVVIGIVCAMGVVIAARTRVLDPLDIELAEERATLTDKGVPIHVPAPEDDSDVQEEKMRAENLRRSLENRTAELASAETESPYRLHAATADANAALLAIAGRNGLHVLKNTSVESPAKGPIPTAASAYELVGLFGAIYGFLYEARREPILWELRDVSIELFGESGACAGSAPPQLILRFTLLLHLYDEDAS